MWISRGIEGEARIVAPQLRPHIPPVGQDLLEAVILQWPRGRRIIIPMGAEIEVAHEQTYWADLLLQDLLAPGPVNTPEAVQPVFYAY